MSKLENKNLIKDAMAEPVAPADLVSSVIERGKAIQEGRLSENTLKERNDLSASEIRELTAKSIIGRLMLNAKMPKGETVDKLVSSLTNNERFQKVTLKDKSKLLLEIQSGDLIKSLANNPSINKKSNVKEKEISQKVL